MNAEQVSFADFIENKLGVSYRLAFPLLIVRTTIHTDALIQVGAPHASEVIIRDLVAPDLREKTAVSVSPSSLNITR